MVLEVLTPFTNMRYLLLTLLLIASLGIADIISDSNTQRELANTAGHVMYPAVTYAVVEKLTDEDTAYIVAMSLPVIEELTDSVFSPWDVFCGWVGVSIAQDYIRLLNNENLAITTDRIYYTMRW